MKRLFIGLALLAAACSGETSTAAERFTLYRNSPLDPSIRVEWASFRADESDPAYNRNNCEMAARLLNANLAAYRTRNEEEVPAGVGFWCEPGGYSEDGPVPSIFDAAFPTDVPEVSQVPA